MKITVIKSKGKTETIVRMEIEDVVKNINDSKFAAEVRNLREIYPFLAQCRQEDGRTVSDFHQNTSPPMLCFALEMQNMKGERRTLSYNGLVLLEANNLSDYDTAISLRNAAARMPQTLMAFVGASGRSVKIVCRGELYPDSKANNCQRQGRHQRPYSAHRHGRDKEISPCALPNGKNCIQLAAQHNVRHHHTDAGTHNLYERRPRHGLQPASRWC